MRLLQGWLFLLQMRLNKNIKIFINYFLGPVLFIWLSYALFRQIQRQPHLDETWQRIKESFYTSDLWYLIAALLLMLINWGIETLKWKYAVQHIHPLKFLQAFKAVLSGVSFSVTTPNRVGEYIGRMMYMPDGKRLKIIAVAIIASFSQLLVTLIVGTAGFLLLKAQLINSELLSGLWYDFTAAGLIISTLILTVLYFNISRIEHIVEYWLKSSSYLYLIEAARDFSMQRLLNLLLLSLLRYGVFIGQYILLFSLFDIDVPLIRLFWLTSLVFLTLAIIPTIALAELGIRGKVAVQLVGLATANTLGILLASVSVWLINLMIPAIAGSILILTIKVFNRRNEKI